MADKTDLTKSLQELEAIAEWFEDQETADVEKGLAKVKQAAKLIKASKSRLAEIENEFQEIEKDIAADSPAEATEDTTPSSPPTKPTSRTKPSSSAPAGDEPINLDDIPF